MSGYGIMIYEKDLEYNVFENFSRKLLKSSRSFGKIATETHVRTCFFVKNKLIKERSV